VTITDVNGCTNAISNFSVGQPDPILLATTPSNPDCFGKSTGTLKVDATGGTPAYTYLWQNAAGENVGNAQVAQMIGAGNYTVTVTDQNGCTSSTTANLQDPPPVIGDYIEPAPLACFGDETILRINTITGGSGGPYTFSIDFGAPLSIDFPVRISGGKHYITYYDGKGCDFTDSTSLFVPEPAQITVRFDPNSVEIELGDSILLSPIVSIGGAAIGSFTWSNVESLLYPTDFARTQAYTFTTTTYTLTVIDTAGCSGTGSITVNIDPNRNVYIPNVFAPGNSSGRNDFFNVFTGLGVEMVNFFRVYDRWGDLMYQRERFMPNSFDLAEGWDGRFNGKFVNPGVYVYVAEVRFLDGRVLVYRGDVTVVR
jgi:gliding motility-associated-like protein